jgi:predicted ribosome quality control (RQC) complex YloA/Tae2 family protein
LVTDWAIVRRLGQELERRLGGARVTEVGLLPDGRTALALRTHGNEVLLAVDAFGSPPVVSLEGALPVTAEPGFTRAAGAALRGMTLRSVRARLGDRLLRLTFSSRSRFGVGDELELFLELVPRFGNLVLVKRDRVVAAAKEFSLAENGRRAVLVGQPYALPPLPSEAPMVPRLVAHSGVAGDRFVAFAQSEEAASEPLYVYRRNGELVQAHLVPLEGFADAASTREPSLLALFAELARRDIGQADRQRAERRRRAAIKRLDERERKLQAEVASLQAKREQARDRDALREQGEAIFSSLHDLPLEERDEAKDRAAKLFAQYKKLGAALPHVERREADVRVGLEEVEALRWEAERVAAEDIDDLEAALGPMRGRATQEGGRLSADGRKSPRKRKRQLLEFRTPAGSRIVVGRSPLENAELTFKLARPNDLWFHARGTPGAHVILARDDRTEAPLEDIGAAASLAAYYSKARSSARVPIDYALRKHVRKQRDAAPGLVWYTNAQTIAVEPQAALPNEMQAALPSDPAEGISALARKRPE